VAPEVAGVADVTVALPRLVGGTGVLETFPLPLSEQEARLLQESARVVRQAMDDLQGKN
jgi:L-lactate dehydrogenase